MFTFAGFTQTEREFNVNKNGSSTCNRLPKTLPRTKRGADTNINIASYYDYFQKQTRGSASSASHEITEDSTFDTQLVTQNPMSSQQAEAASGSSEQRSSEDGAHLETIYPKNSKEDDSEESDDYIQMESSWMSSQIGATAFPKITGNFSFGSQMSTKQSPTNVCFLAIFVLLVWTTLMFYDTLITSFYL